LCFGVVAAWTDVGRLSAWSAVPATAADRRLKHTRSDVTVMAANSHERT